MNYDDFNSMHENPKHNQYWEFYIDGMSPDRTLLFFRYIYIGGSHKASWTVRYVKGQHKTLVRKLNEEL